jgi:hypothetical protein
MVTFHAKEISWSNDFGCTVLTLDAVGEGAEYVMFQRPHRGNARDTEIYVERRSQGWANWSGVSVAELRRNQLSLKIIEPLGDESEFTILFELELPKFQQLKTRLRKIFRDRAEFVDRSAGERLQRHGKSAFVETLKRLAEWFEVAPAPCSHEILSEVEEEEGIPIPPLLREYYLRFGEDKMFSNARGILSTPDMLEYAETSGHLVLWLEHADDGGTWCGIPPGALDQPDPPVERKIWNDDDEIEWLPECETLSAFLFQTLVWQAAWGLPERLTMASSPTILARLTPVVPDRAYAAEGLAAFVREETIWIGAVSKERLQWLLKEE